MTDPVEPIALTYAAGPRLRTLARLPIFCALAVSLIIPGFASMLLGAGWGGKKFALLSGSVAFAFLFFGPFWGEILFRGTRYKESGLVPFLVVYACSLVSSGIIAIRDWKFVRRSMGLDSFG